MKNNQRIRDHTNIPTRDVVCSVCKQLKCYRSFTYYRRRFTEDGLRLRVNTNCLDCQRKLAKERTEAKKNAPPKPEVCDICGKVPPNSRNWQLDHDHQSGKYAGWLCKDCNVGLGKLGDSATTITKAWMYAMKNRADLSNDLILQVKNFIDKVRM